jgi:glutamate 5-kinase
VPGPPTLQATPSHAAAGTPAGSRSLLFADLGIGTTLLPAPKPVTGRKRWILSLSPEGSLVLDAGAVAAITEHRKSLFPAGVLAVEGDFEAQDAVHLLDEHGRELARALVNYNAEDCRRLHGHHSKEIAGLLGYLGAETLADRDNIVILHGDESTATRPHILRRMP